MLSPSGDRGKQSGARTLRASGQGCGVRAISGPGLWLCGRRRVVSQWSSALALNMGLRKLS